MPAPKPVSRLTIWMLSIAMKERFRHAAAERSGAEPIIVAIELADRTIGYGETHPRPYVTGETVEDVIRSIREDFLPLLVEMRPSNFGEAIELAAGLPLRNRRGRVITAARAAVELALLDAYSQAFDRSLASLAGWVCETWLGSPGSRGAVRFGGVLTASDPAAVGRSIRKMRLGRLRDFKLKVGDEQDEARLQAAVRALGRGLESGRTSLRLDANGAWTLPEAIERLRNWERLPIVCVEQPLAKAALGDWTALAAKTCLPLMADESLVTPEDAESLIHGRCASWFNIRISKNGGLIPALRLAVLAHEHQVDAQLGCMVGETSILSAAGRWFLQLVPGVRFAEGNFGRFLLKEDVSDRSLRFGLGGRWKTLEGPGLGAKVSIERLQRLSSLPAVELPL